MCSQSHVLSVGLDHPANDCDLVIQFVCVENDDLYKSGSPVVEMWTNEVVPPAASVHGLRKASFLHLVTGVLGEWTSRSLLIVETGATTVVLEEDRDDRLALASWRLVSLSEVGRQSRA